MLRENSRPYMFLTLTGSSMPSSTSLAKLLVASSASTRHRALLLIESDLRGRVCVVRRGAPVVPRARPTPVAAQPDAADPARGDRRGEGDPAERHQDHR